MASIIISGNGRTLQREITQGSARRPAVPPTVRMKTTRRDLQVPRGEKHKSRFTDSLRPSARLAGLFLSFNSQPCAHCPSPASAGSTA